MPTYEYICRSCDHEMEAFQSMKDPHLVDCPACHEPALQRRIGRGAGIVFKGSGFYQTDYKSSGSGKEGGTDKSSGAPSASPEKAPASAKPASAAPAAAD